MAFEDRYGLPVSTSSEAAAQAYRHGIDLMLSAWPGAAQAMDLAIETDGDFALAYAARSRNHLIYAELEQAVRDGARYAAARTYDSATSTPSDAFLAAVQNVVVYGDPAPATGATAVAPGLTTGNVTVTVTFTSGVPTSMAVAISGYQMPTYYGNATLNGKPTTSFPFVGIFGPP